ncbi:PucR family transcriptional regulator [Brevibacterium spongiae]|uniref:Helix-turn-helix domain-containing protein n=1 Tax=Brevibacterium spongiae TaxID=2909672 RepID=A0ABY5SM54_9MICO|nr:helix-turn-helix domain-containing protein [Brevibacterium spongiae]UVI35542.1 helix-turn-helix domain-containing protein [Brevibacterium spongiae]
MTDTASPRLSRLIRDTEGFLLPLTEAAEDVVITRIEFGFDLSTSNSLAEEVAPTRRTVTSRRGAEPAALPRRTLTSERDAGTAEHGTDTAVSGAVTTEPGTRSGTVVLVTEPVRSRAGLGSVVAEYAGAAALVLPPGSHSHLGEAAIGRGSGGETPVLLERSSHVTWSEALVHLRQLTEGATSAVAWPDVDDLSALAAVIAESTGASITIEDPASRVLAHANLGDDLDEIRRETILSGAIPDWRIAELEESGFLDTIRRSTDVVERPAEGTSPARSVIALRSEGELIGTIWAAYPAEVDPAPLREILRDAARAALPVMLRTLRRSPFEKRIRREALAAILAGSAELGPSATLLALPFAGHYCVLAFAEVAPEREPVLRFHLRAAFADAVLSQVESGTGSHLAALVQMSAPSNAAQIRDHVASTLRRSLPDDEALSFGVGSPVDRLDEVHRSWSEAAYVVDAVNGRQASGGAQAAPTIIGATAADAAAEVIGLRVADTLLAAEAAETAEVGAAGAGAAVGAGAAIGADGAEPAGRNPDAGSVVWPARALARHDANHNGSLLETLRVYFATVGNSAEASRRLHVHTNSLRHRLGRIEEITGLSTVNPAERLWLELAVLAHDRAGG